MRMEDVNARKAYIQNVRKSFDSPGREYEFQKNTDTKGEAMEGFSFFKVRLIAAALIFAAYIFCDKTNTAVYTLTAKDVSEKIVENMDYEKARGEILEVFQVIQQKEP